MKPTHFDLTVNDLAQARAFFERVLGWRFERFQMPFEYYLITAGPGTEPGINGGMGSIKDAALSGGRPMTQVTVAVADLDQTVGRVQANGGRILEPRMPIPGIGWYATCAEPGGLAFGLLQEDASAGRSLP